MMDAAMTSSPDPLNEDFEYRSPVKPRMTTRTARTIPLSGSSPRKQTFELDVGLKSSPHKIRVTVEADNSDKENIYAGPKHQSSPTRRRGPRAPAARINERTTTTKIPLKGLSDSEDASNGTPDEAPRRGRGRPKKSAGTPIKSKGTKKVSTPTGRRRSIGSVVDGDDEEDWDFHVGKGVVFGRGKGRSRSRSVKGSEATTANNGSLESTTSSAVSKRGKARRKTLVPEDLEILVQEAGSASDARPDDDVLSGMETHDGSARYVSPSASPLGSEPQPDGGNDEPVLVNRPRETDVPSPRIDSSSHTQDASHRVASQLLSPTPSPEKSVHNDEDDGSRCVYADDEEDGIGELRDFDTIMESEGFSMISVDSVPSLREHFSSPAFQHRTVQDVTPVAAMNNVRTAAITNNGLSSNRADLTPSSRSIRNSQLFNLKNTQEDSFSSIAPGIMEAATPAAEKLQNPRLRAVQPSSVRTHDSFSSIPPSVLEAATPGPPRRSNDVSKIRRHHQNDKVPFPFIPLETSTAASSARPQMRQSASSENSHGGTNKSTSTEAPAPIEPSHLAPPERESSRLLTPEETPSPHSAAVVSPLSKPFENVPEPVARIDSLDQAVTADSSLLSQMQSSPPQLPNRFPNSDTLRQERGLPQKPTETPSVFFSSPTLPPLPQCNTRPHAASDASSSRQGLLSIARAGRALQNIAVPSSTSRSRSQSLRSPFSSPTAGKSPGFAKSPPHASTEDATPALPTLSQYRVEMGSLHSGLAAKFSSGTRRELRKSLLAGQAAAIGKSGVQSSVQEDPFTIVENEDARSVLPVEKTNYQLGKPGQGPSLRRPLVGANPSKVNAGRSDRAAASQQEARLVMASHVYPPPSASNEDASAITSQRHKIHTTALTRQGEREWANQRKSVSLQIDAADSAKVTVIDSNDEESSDIHPATTTPEQDPPGAAFEDLVEEDGMDIWLEEARNSSHLGVEVLPTVEVRRDSSTEKSEKTEAPTMQKYSSKQRTNQHSSAVAQPSPMAGHLLPEATLRGIQASRDDSVTPSPIIHNNSNVVSQQPLQRQDSLVSDRNRTLVEGKLKDGSSLDPSGLVELGIDSTSPADLSQIHLPQKSNFAPRVRAKGTGNFDLSALLGSTPAKMPRLASPVASPSQRIGLQLHRNIFQTAPPQFQAIPFASISLAPSAEQVDASIEQFDSSSLDGQNPTLDEASSELSSPPTSSSLINSLLDNVAPLQPSALTPSPKKSCLRSSLATPGRNVVWIGLPSSPNTTTQSATENDISATDQLLASGPFAQTKLTVDYHHQTANPDQIVPATTGTPLRPLLSSTVWSKAHWKILDSIFIDVKTSLPLSEELEAAYASSKLLGKVIRAEGERMKIEAWHLDIVACFADEVPGWDDGAIMKRVFGLVKGAERREQKRKIGV